MKKSFSEKKWESEFYVSNERDFFFEREKKWVLGSKKWVLSSKKWVLRKKSEFWISFQIHSSFKFKFLSLGEKTHFLDFPFKSISLSISNFLFGRKYIYFWGSKNPEIGSEDPFSRFLIWKGIWKGGWKGKPQQPRGTPWWNLSF